MSKTAPSAAIRTSFISSSSATANRRASGRRPSEKAIAVDARNRHCDSRHGTSANHLRLLAAGKITLLPTLPRGYNGVVSTVASAPTSSESANAADEMLARVRAFDWSQTPLGPMSQWPEALRVAVDICLSSRFPMFVWWGPEL